ncbi:hypothetical protein [Methylobacterium oxalidis]|uniref:hypothetical protein n=1 Tax=Methylobacterium oxalidis TaxID=944322 RepID=UPI003315DD9D
MGGVIGAVLSVGRWSLMGLGLLTAIVFTDRILSDPSKVPVVFSPLVEVKSPDGLLRAAAYETRRTIGGITFCTIHLFVVGAREGSGPTDWDEGDRVLATDCDVLGIDRVPELVSWSAADTLAVQLPVLRGGMQFSERAKNSEVRIAYSLLH